MKIWKHLKSFEAVASGRPKRENQVSMEGCAYATKFFPRVINRYIFFAISLKVFCLLDIYLSDICYLDICHPVRNCCNLIQMVSYLVQDYCPGRADTQISILTI